MQPLQNDIDENGTIPAKPKISIKDVCIVIATVLVASGSVLHFRSAGYEFSGTLISGAGIIIGACTFLYESRRKKWRQVISSPFLKSFAIFVLVAVIISAITSFTRAGINALPIYLLGFALAVTFWSLKVSEKIIIPAIICASVAESLTVLLNGPGGSFGNGNYAGAFLAITLPFSFWLISRGTQGILLCIFACALSAVAIWITGSRGAMLALFAAIFFGSVLFAARNRQSKIHLLIPVVLIASAAISLLSSERFSRLISGDDASLTVRVELTKASITMFTDNPFGIGAGNYENAIEKYRTEKEVQLSHQFSDAYCPARNAHNSYIQILCEIGPVGLLAFLYLLFVPIYRVTRFYFWLESPDRSAAICAAMSLVAFAVQNAFNSIFIFAPFVLLFSLIAVMVDSRLNPFPLPTSALDTQRHITLLFSLLVLTVCCCFVKYRNIRSEMLVSDAAEEKNRERRIALLDEALALNFFNERAYLDKNSVLLESIRVVEEPRGSGKVIRVYGNLGEALSPLENLVNSVNPDHPVALFRLAKYNYLAGKFELAESYRARLENAIHGWYLTDYVHALRAYMKGDIVTAEKFIERAKLKNPRFAISINNLHDRN